MLHRDALLKKQRETPPRRDFRGVNVTPALSAPNPHRESGTSRPDPSPPTERAQQPGSPAGSRLIVGPDIKLKGVEITDCDTLVVEGSVEASMNSRVIQITEQGIFTGTVNIDIADIRGRFEGELTAREQLVIHAGGKVSGKIRYGRIKIEEGAEISGDVAQIEAKPLRSMALLKTTGNE